MKKIFILQLFLLFSCQVPQIKPQTRCFFSVHFNYASQESIDDFFENIYNYQEIPELREEFLLDVLDRFGMTVCRDYDLMTGEPIGVPKTYPAIKMDEYGGFSAEDWAIQITPWIKETRQYLDDHGFKN